MTIVEITGGMLRAARTRRPLAWRSGRARANRDASRAANGAESRSAKSYDSAPPGSFSARWQMNLHFAEFQGSTCACCPTTSTRRPQASLRRATFSGLFRPPRPAEGIRLGRPGLSQRAKRLRLAVRAADV